MGLEIACVRCRAWAWANRDRGTEGQLGGGSFRFRGREMPRNPGAGGRGVRSCPHFYPQNPLDFCRFSAVPPPGGTGDPQSLAAVAQDQA